MHGILNLYPEDGGSTFLFNVSDHLSDYYMLHLIVLLFHYEHKTAEMSHKIKFINSFDWFKWPNLNPKHST
jgi:hypothetical protein